MADAIGLVECASFAAVLEATDVMLKTGKISLLSMERTGGGRVTVVVRGSLDNVRSAIEMGVRAAENVGEVIALHVIDDAHPDLYQFL